MNPRIERITSPENGPQLFMLRDDLTDPDIPGNKLRKLKYNLEAARNQNHDKLLTFGGAFSNHIAAVAAAGKKFGFKTIGVIRGDELAGQPLNPTLERAVHNGMKLQFVDRTTYRQRDSEAFREGLEQRFGRFYLLPEGGTNELAVRGCEEIVQNLSGDFTYICCAVGTGGTIAGISRAVAPGVNVLGFPALKGDFMEADITRWTSGENLRIIRGFEFGGYARIDKGLVRFMADFEAQNKIPLDPVYTAKMIYGLNSLVEQGFFRPQDKILAVHTGGLQGLEGMKERMKLINETDE